MRRLISPLACCLAFAFFSGCEDKPAPDKGPTSVATPKPADASGASPSSSDTNTPAESKADPGAKPQAEAKSAAESQPAPKPLEVDPLDWANWRGPEQDRISRETGLIDTWDPEEKDKAKSHVLWTNDEAGGRCTPIVMRGKLYTIVRYKPGTRYEQEQLLCLDAATGKEIWRTTHNMFLTDCPAERIGWASPVGDPTTGRVYAYGSNCLMRCCDGDTGKVIWERSLAEQFGFLSTFGGRANYPIVFDDLVIVSAVETGWGDRSTPAHRFLALDKNTGEVRWANKGTTEKPEDTTFGTPTVKVVDGQMQLIDGSSDGSVWSFQPRTGAALWFYHMSRRGLSCSPFVAGDNVYEAQNEENLDNSTQGMVAEFSAKRHAADSSKPEDLTKTNTVWKHPGLMLNKSTQSSAVVVDGRLYCSDNGSNFYVLNATDGKVVKKEKLIGSETVGSPLYADGKIYLCSTSGWHVFRPTAKGMDVVQKLRMEHEDEILGSPIVSHGRIYLPTLARIYCLGTEDQKPAAAPIPEATAEQPVAADDKPATVQVVPGVVLLNSGEKQQFRARLYNERGQFLREGDAKFSVAGPGKIDEASGLYQAPDGSEHTAATVTAMVGEVSGQARVRVTPPLPWKFDFQKTPLVANPKNPKLLEGLAPITWVGLRYRHVVRVPDGLDGRKVLVKVNTIPKGTRSQGWMGSDRMHDYTIQSDVRATSNQKNNPAGGMADVGLIAQRYTMVLMGSDQQLQIRYWPTQVATQFSKTIPFNWKPDVWYSMKFRAGMEGEKAVLKGKVWPRDEKEPDAWTIEADDDMPNTEGSPGLAGDTSNKGEFYYDNIQIYSNDAPPLAAAENK